MDLKETTGLSLLLGFTKHELRQQIDVILRPLELSAAQYTALCQLEHQGSSTNADLARACYVTPQTMIRILAKFKERGLVKPMPSEASNRELPVCITDQALKLLCQAHVLVNELEEKTLQGLDAKRRALLFESLDIMFANLKD